MAQIVRSALVAYSAQQMFDLVNDIAAYPEFMPGCVDSKVIKADSKAIEAELVLGKSGIEQRFTTRNTLNPPESMVMALIEGPFKHFEGRWEFQTLEPQACKVVFTLDFAFSNPLLGMAVGSWLENIASQQVEAVEKRAAVIYK